MLRMIFCLVAVLVAGCSGGVPDGVPVTYGREGVPQVADPVDVPVDADVCGLVDADVLDDLGLDAAGEGRAGLCQWKSTTGRRLMVGLRPEGDPLLEIVGSVPESVELVQVDLRGFPAVHARKPRDMCDVYVKTAARQGFAVLYRGDDEPCAGALGVAERVAERIRG